jgi:tetratricopeptide (TPR) repeat protein
MSAHDRIRRKRSVTQAEGYLELGMPSHALEVLERAGPLETLSSHGLYLKGEGLRSLGRFPDAIDPLSLAAQRDPTNIHVWLALGWCHKRSGRIDLAIESLEEALAVDPDDALVHYNLACYWALANSRQQALAYLARAFEREEQYRMLVADEPDFDSIRSDPDFQALARVTV